VGLREADFCQKTSRQNFGLLERTPESSRGVQGLLCNILVLSSKKDGDLFRSVDLADDRDLRMLIYFDETAVVHFNRNESIGVVKLIPANYPMWVRSNARLWWNVLLIPTELLAHSDKEECRFKLDYYLKILFDDLMTHVAKGKLSCIDSLSGDTIWDAFTKAYFQLDVAICGVLGDLPGRSVLFHLAKSYSRLYRWCHICTGTRENPRARNSLLRTTAETIRQAEIIDSLREDGNKALKDHWKQVSR
jgi:hypothetical protein